MVALKVSATDSYCSPAVDLRIHTPVISAVVAHICYTTLSALFQLLLGKTWVVQEDSTVLPSDKVVLDESSVFEGVFAASVEHASRGSGQGPQLQVPA